MNLYTYCYNNPLLYTDPTGNTPKDYFAGLANALDDNITSGALRWVLGKMLKVNQNYQYDNAVDYYAGRVTGDILSMVGGSSSIVSGLGTIVASVLGGGAITVSSGGVLVVGGGAIVVEGVIGGTAQVTYGGIILSASAKNFGNDLNKLKEASNKGTGSRSGDIDVDNLPSGWSKTTNNGFTHVRDVNGKIRVRIDPPDGKTPYYHKHLYDKSGNSLDINGNVVNPKSPDAHIPLK